MSCLLVEQDPHSLPRLHSTADHSHQLGFDEIFTLLHFSLPRGGGPPGPGGRPLDVHRPVGVSIFGVVHFTEWFI